MSAAHHAWVKVKDHNYICRKCGMRKVNVNTGRDGWIAEWHAPDGSVARLRLAPPCAVGPETAERLAWLAGWQGQQLLEVAPEGRPQ